MSDEFVNHSGIKWNGHVGTVEYGGGDKTMIAMFYNKAIQNPQKSLENGRPYFEDVIYVRIHPPGERLNIVDRPANATDKRRWPMQWAQFMENRVQMPEGTPVDLLYPDQPSVAAVLRANHVYTIEQCAELSGNAIEEIGMGSQRYVNDSKKYLEAANKGVGASQLRRELEDRDGKIRTLEHQISLLQAKVEQLQDNNTTNVDLAQLQALMAGLQGRPQFPKAPGIAPVFDSQTAQINATHVTQDIKPKRTRTRVKE